MPSIPYVMPQLLNLTPLAASGNSNPISLPPRSATCAVVFHIKFTKGSLTNGQVFVQALNPDGSTWADLIGGGSTVLSTGTLSADTNIAIYCVAAGAKQLRCRYTTTGTVTSSVLVIDATVQQ
jgi:hypothetical protein